MGNDLPGMPGMPGMPKMDDRVPGAVVADAHPDDPRASFQALLDQVRGLRKRLAGHEKLLKPLAQEEAWSRPEKCRAALDKLEKTISAAPPPGWRPELLEESRRFLARREQELPRRVVATLFDKCASGDPAFQWVSRPDFEFKIGPMTLILHPKEGKASILYARELAGTAPLDADKVWLEVQSGLRRLGAAAGDPASFFGDLLAAYRGLVAEQRLKFGDRVDIADLPGRITVRRMKRSFWYSPQAKSFRPFTRAMLAYGLDQLVQARALSRDGFRLKLGSATMDTTKKKENVLFLERGQAGGQYYLTLWFEPVAELPALDEP